MAARDAANEARILGWLDGSFGLLRDSTAFLMPWLDANAVDVGAAVSVVIGIIVIAAVVTLRRDAVPIVWFGTTLALGVWGEVCLLDGQSVLGVALFAACALSALVLGMLHPLPVLGATSAPAPSAGMSVAGEAALVTGLIVSAFVMRVYALNEVPVHFENEMILSMLSSRTLAGLHEYIPWGMVSNTNGMIHVILQWLTFEVLGTSVFSLRFTAAFWWTVSVPIFYVLLRRMGGVAAAVIGTVLLITAPEQLFWARSESVCLTLLTPVAIITAALSFRLATGPRGWLFLAVLTLWLPFTRYFYTPVIVLLFFTVLVYAHAFLVDRSARRAALRVVPALAVAAGLWFYSLSAVHHLLDGDSGRFVNPLQTGGVSVWQGEGAFRVEGLGDLVVKQATNLAANAQTVAAAMTYDARFNNWYRRGDVSAHPTTINVAVSVLIVVGIGYLLGQLRDPRAFGLLALIGFGLAPAVLSLDPAPRRMGLAYPAFYAAVALTLAALLHYVRANAGRWLRRLVRGVVAVGLLGVAWLSVGSHFVMPMAPTYVDEVRRVSKPVFAESDVVFHTLAPIWTEILAFLHGDKIFAAEDTICMRKVGRLDLLSAALRHDCDFEEVSYRYSLWPEQRAALRSTYDPQHLSYLVSDDAANVRGQQLLRSLFPDAPATPLSVRGTAFSVLWFQVPRQTVEAVRAPLLQSNPAEPERSRLLDGLLADVRLSDQPVDGMTGFVVAGGMLIESEGWYTLALAPACDAATLEIDGIARLPEQRYPLTAGVHAFALRLPDAIACTLPLRLEAQRYERGVMVDIPSPTLVAPGVAELPLARGRALVRHPGYVETSLGFDPTGIPLDMGIDGSGVLVVLYDDHGTIGIERVRPDGSREASWRLDGGPPVGLSVAPDGTAFVVYQDGVKLYDRSGRRLQSWSGPPVRTHGLGHLPGGNVLSPTVEHQSVNVLDRRGRLVRKWRTFEGGRGMFIEPVAVDVNERGDVVVTQVDGTALRFKTPTDRFDPVFVDSFRIDFDAEAVFALGWELDAAGRLIVPEPGLARTFIYELDGARVMAVEPAADLQHLVNDQLRRVVAADGAVYTLDGPRRLRRFVHESDQLQS